MFGGGLQGFGSAAHLAGAGKGCRNGDEEKRRQRHGGGEQRKLLHIEANQPLRPEIAPEISAPDADPEGRQHGGKSQGRSAKTRRGARGRTGRDPGFGLIRNNGRLEYNCLISFEISNHGPAFGHPTLW
jgi:hypothetical protein